MLSPELLVIWAEHAGSQYRTLSNWSPETCNYHCLKWPTGCSEAIAKAASCLGLKRHKVARSRDYSGLTSVGWRQLTLYQFSCPTYSFI